MFQIAEEAELPVEVEKKVGAGTTLHNCGKMYDVVGIQIGDNLEPRVILYHAGQDSAHVISQATQLKRRFHVIESETYWNDSGEMCYKGIEIEKVTDYVPVRTGHTFEVWYRNGTPRAQVVDATVVWCSLKQLVAVAVVDGDEIAFTMEEFNANQSGCQVFEPLGEDLIWVDAVAV